MPDSLAGGGGSGLLGRPISFQRKADVSMVSLPFARLEWKESSNVSLAFLSKYILDNIPPHILS
jgi:hypothetical protein